MYGIKQATPPSIEPVTLTELKAHCRVSTTDDDTYLTGLITVARRWIEDVCNRALINQTWDYFLDCFPDSGGWTGGIITLPKAPVSVVNSIKYNDDAGVLQTLSAGQYVVDIRQDPCRIALAYGVVVWPVTRVGLPSAVQINFDCGYGATAGTVPDEFKHAIKMMCGHLYENREDSISGTIIQRMPMGLDMLINSLRMALA